MLVELRKIHSEMRKILIREENGNIRNEPQQQSATNQDTSEMGGYTSNGNWQQTSSSHTSASTIPIAEQMINGSSTTTNLEVPSLLKNPDVVPRKGRPKNMQKSRRLIPYGEMVRTKKQITCSTCGSHDHNKATCSKLPAEGAAMKKKATAKKKGQSNTNHKHSRCKKFTI